jgi:N-acetylmuramoyl-L-alanine amidase
MITTLMLDRGHGLLDEKGVYVTPGKRAKLPDGTMVYEGIENEKYVIALAKHAKEAGFKVIYTIPPKDFKDMSLVDRVKKANNHPNKNSMLFVSVHNNAANGTATGTEIFTSIGQTLSDVYAESILRTYQTVYPERRLRVDRTDGDLDKEANFYVLRHTHMPAILIEYGFFDTPSDYAWLSNPNTIDKMAALTIDGIVSANIELYGKDAWLYRKTI